MYPLNSHCLSDNSLEETLSSSCGWFISLLRNNILFIVICGNSRDYCWFFSRGMPPEIIHISDWNHFFFFCEGCPLWCNFPSTGLVTAKHVQVDIHSLAQGHVGILLVISALSLDLLVKRTTSILLTCSSGTYNDCLSLVCQSQFSSFSLQKGVSLDRLLPLRVNTVSGSGFHRRTVPLFALGLEIKNRKVCKSRGGGWTNAEDWGRWARRTEGRRSPGQWKKERAAIKPTASSERIIVSDITRPSPPCFSYRPWISGNNDM